MNILRDLLAVYGLLWFVLTAIAVFKIAVLLWPLYFGEKK